MTVAEYLEPNRKAQIVVLLMVLIGLLFGFGAESIFSLITPQPDGSLGGQETSANLLIFLLAGVFLVEFAIAVVWASYFVQLGYRALKLQIYPPPGTIVLSRTKIRTGKQATLMGCLSISFSALMALFTTLMGYGLWILTKAL